MVNLVQKLSNTLEKVNKKRAVRDLLYLYGLQ